MRKIVALLHSSLDGKVQGPTPWDLGWISHGPDVEAFATDAFREASTVLWGRVTYEGMLNHWPAVASDPASTAYERHHAAWLDSTEMASSCSPQVSIARASAWCRPARILQAPSP